MSRIDLTKNNVTQLMIVDIIHHNEHHSNACKPTYWQIYLHWFTAAALVSREGHLEDI